MAKSKPARGWARIAGAALVGAACFGAAGNAGAVRPAGSKARLREVARGLPVIFEGHADGEFVARSASHVLTVSKDGADFVLAGGESPVRMRFVVGDQTAAGRSVAGARREAGAVNYLIGNDRSKWQTGIAAFREVRCEDPWPGIDVVWHGDRRALEYDCVVEPGADPGRIRVRYDGLSEPPRVEDGDLVLTTPDGEIRQHRPVAWEEGNGEERRDVIAEFDVHDDGTVGFVVEGRDPRRTLVLDPAVVTQATYLASTGSDTPSGIDLDSAGNIYIAGISVGLGNPTQMPTTALAAQPNYAGGESDAFVACFSPDGSQLLYLTYLGGSGSEVREYGPDVAVEQLAPGGPERAWVCGSTFSDDFPTGTLNSFSKVLQPFKPGVLEDQQGNVVSTNTDGFVACLTESGRGLYYSTYLGGKGPHRIPAKEINSEDLATAIDVRTFRDGFGGVSETIVAVVGATRSTEFPTTSGVRDEKDPDACRNAADVVLNNSEDAFVATFVVSATGSTVTQGPTTYFGGARNNTPQGGCSPGADDRAVAVAIGPDGVVRFAGTTYSKDPLLPVTLGAFQPTPATSIPFEPDGFVAALSSDFSHLRFCTYLGGSGMNDLPDDLFVDDGGEFVVVGRTDSEDFPPKNAFFAVNQGGTDAFVTAFDSSFSVRFSTYLGGAAHDRATGVGIANSGKVVVTGYTSSGGFPLLNASRTVLESSDGFLTTFLRNGTLDSSTLIGTLLADEFQALALTPGGDAVVTGTSPPSFKDVAKVSQFGTFPRAKVSLVVKLGNGPPKKPENLVAKSNDFRSADLDWEDKSDNEDGFIVERRLVTKKRPLSYVKDFAEIVRTGGSSSVGPFGHHDDLQIRGGASYAWRVAAFNSQGVSDWSNIAAAKILLPGKISVKPTKFSFRSVVGVQVTKTLRVKNIGKGPLHVDFGSPTGPFSVSGPGSVDLDPGVAALVDVVYESDAVGTVSDTFAVTSDDPKKPTVNVSLMGRTR